MHVVSERKLGLPKSSREAFKLLEGAGTINQKLAKALMNMVGFRNIAVYDYQNIDLRILQTIIETHLKDFTDYTKIILKLK